MKNPYSKSTTRDSDIVQSPWPVIPQGFYERIAADHQIENIDLSAESLNVGTASLVLAKLSLFNTRLRLLRAARLNKNKEKVAQRLESLIADLKELEKRFPLEITGRLRRTKAKATGLATPQ